MPTLKELELQYQDILVQQGEKHKGFKFKKISITKDSFIVCFHIEKREFKIETKQSITPTREHVLSIDVSTEEKIKNRWHSLSDLKGDISKQFIWIFDMAKDLWIERYHLSGSTIFLLSAYRNVVPDELISEIQKISPAIASTQSYNIISKPYHRESFRNGVIKTLIGYIVDPLEEQDIQSYLEAEKEIKRFCDEHSPLLAIDSRDRCLLSNKVLLTNFLQYSLGIWLSDDFTEVKLRLLWHGEKGKLFNEIEKYYSINELSEASKWLQSLEEENGLLHLFEPPFNHLKLIFEFVGLGLRYEPDKGTFKERIDALNNEFESWHDLEQEFKLITLDMKNSIKVMEDGLNNNRKYRKLKISGRLFDLFIETWAYNDGLISDIQFDWEFKKSSVLI